MNDKAVSSSAPPDTSKPAAPAPLDREQAILDFNRRVLAQAERADVPLLERLRYVTIVSSNLDEFFEVRFADYMEAVREPVRWSSIGTASATSFSVTSFQRKPALK